MNKQFPTTLRRFLKGRKSDTYTLIVQHYYKGVYEIISNILETEKEFNESDAVDFTDNLFSMNNKNYLQIKNIVEICYSDGKTKKELNYKPPFSTEGGIKKMVISYKNREKSNSHYSFIQHK
jgi:hypothetical protein